MYYIIYTSGMNNLHRKNKDFLKIEWMLNKLGIKTSPSLVTGVKIFLFIFCILGIIFFNSGGGQSNQGNYDEMCKEYPEIC